MPAPLHSSAGWLSAREAKLQKLRLSQRNTPTPSPGLDIDLSEAFSSAPPSDSEEDSSSEPRRSSRASKFPELFSHEEITALLRREGVLDALAAKGFAQPRLAFDTRDDLHRLVLTHAAEGFQPNGSVLLADVWMRRRKLWALDSLLSYQLVCRLDACGSWQALGEQRMQYMSVELARDVRRFLEQAWPRAQSHSKRGIGEIDVVEISWLQLQNPLKPVTDDRPLLPGQRYPGLGVARQVGAALLSMARASIACDAYSNGPLAWVNASFYQRDGHRGVSPAFDAYVEWSTRQLQSAIAQHGLAMVCWSWNNGHIRRRRSDGSIEVEVWDAEDQVLPTGENGHDAFTGLLNSRTYQSLRRRALDEMSGDELFIDLDAAPECWSKSHDPALRQRARELAERA